MAAKPPQNETSDPDVIEFGIASLAARLEETEIQYPVSGEQLVHQIDNTEIPIDGSGNTVALETALARVPKNEFTSESELLDVLHPVFEEYRQQAGTSFFGRLRALLPF